MYPRSFGFQYNVEKRVATGIVTLYSTDGTSGQVRAFIKHKNISTYGANVASSLWTANTHYKACDFIPVDSSTAATSVVTGVGISAEDEAYITFHWTCDARIGIV